MTKLKPRLAAKSASARAQADIAAPASSGNTLKLDAAPDTSRATLLARAALSPHVRAAVTTNAYSKVQFGDVDLTELTKEFSAQSREFGRGEMRVAEDLLFSQALTLQALFHDLARRAGLNMGEYLGAAETYMRLALKAQSQCRATLETLAVLKNPPHPTFIRQANVAHGPQQVNNSPSPDSATAPSRAREIENEQNRLLEQPQNEILDKGPIRATLAATLNSTGQKNDAR